MTGHILNRSLAPRPLQPAAKPKPTPEQAAAVKRLQRTKDAEAVGRAIARTTR